MYCPNCGSQNKKKQNYCRFCGLSLHDIERTYLNQLVFGKDTQEAQNFRNVRKVVDYTEILLIVAGVATVLTLYFSGYPVKLRLFGIVIAVTLLFDVVRRIIRHFEQKRFRENNKDQTLPGTKDETTKLIEEKMFVLASVTEHSTQLLTKIPELNKKTDSK